MSGPSSGESWLAAGGEESLDGDSDDEGYYGVVWPHPFLSSLG